MLFPLLRCWLCAVLVGLRDRRVQRVLDHGRVLPVDGRDDPVQRRPYEVVPVVLKGDRLGLGLFASLDGIKRLRELAPDDDGYLFLRRLHGPTDSRGLEEVERRERSLLASLAGVEQLRVLAALEHYERNHLHRLTPRTPLAARPRPPRPSARRTSRIPPPACRATRPRRWRPGGPRATRRRRGTGSWPSERQRSGRGPRCRQSSRPGRTGCRR